MKNKILLSLFLTSFFSLSASADCTQANLWSADGSQITIKYSTFNLSDGDTAWVNPTIEVTLSNGKCYNQQVIAYLVNSQFGFSGSRPQTLTRDGLNACKFSAKLNHVTIGNHGGALGQQIAIGLIDSQGNKDWLVDSVASSHNFNYKYLTTNYTPTEEICK